MSKFNYFEFRYQKLNMIAFVCAINSKFMILFFSFFFYKKKTDRKEGLNLNW